VTFTEAQFKALLAERPQLRMVDDADVVRDDRPEAVMLAEIQRLAKQHGWLGEHTWNAQGPNSGLQCLLVRERVVLALILGPRQKISMAQQTWLEVLRRTGDVDVYCWHAGTKDQAVMQERLSRRRTPERSEP